MIDDDESGEIERDSVAENLPPPQGDIESSEPPMETQPTQSKRSKKRRKKNERATLANRDSDLCINDDVLLRYNSEFKDRTIQFGRVVDFNFFARYQFRIPSLFRAIGWYDFLHQNNSMYPRLVSAFYAGFKLEKSPL